MISGQASVGVRPAMCQEMTVEIEVQIRITLAFDVNSMLQLCLSSSALPYLIWHVATLICASRLSICRPTVAIQCFDPDIPILWML